MEKIEDLEPQLQSAVRIAIKTAAFKRAHQSRKFGPHEVYAYPTPHGIAWGVNSAPDYVNTARGVVAP